MNTGGDAQGDILLNMEIVGGSYYNDSITGDANNNNLFGLSGNDTLIGGAGADTLTGGAGNDIFVFKAISDSATATPDMIMDFLHDTDHLDVRGLGFTGIINGAASGANLGYSYNATTDQMTIASANGLKIVLVGHPTIDGTDFLFA